MRLSPTFSIFYAFPSLFQAHQPNLGIMRKYARHFPQCLLTEISGAKIDTMLGLIKNAGNRLKCTKPELVDIVPVSADLAAKLIAHIEKHPAKGNGQAFIFSSVTDVYKPLRYESINKDFNKTFARKEEGNRLKYF